MFPPEINEEVYSYLDMPNLERATSTSRAARGLFTKKTKDQARLNSEIMDKLKQIIRENPDGSGDIMPAMDAHEQQTGESFTEDDFFELALWIARNNHPSWYYDSCAVFVERRSEELYKAVRDQTNYLDENGRHSMWLEREEEWDLEHGSDGEEGRQSSDEDGF